MAKRKKCRERYCQIDALGFGFCKQHQAERDQKDRRRQNAEDLLRTGRVLGKPLVKESLRAEYLKLLTYYDDARYALRFEKKHGVIDVEEAESALSWCRGIAEIIFYEELHFIEHPEGDLSNSYNREYLWKRFENLELGLRSNGTEK